LNKYLLIITILLSSGTLFGQPINGRIDLLSIKHGIDGLEVKNFFFDKENKIWLKTQDCLNICSPKKVKNVYFGKETHNIHSNSNIETTNEYLDKIDIFFKNELWFFDRYDKEKKSFTKILITTIPQYSNQTYIQTTNYNNNVFLISQSNSTLLIKDLYNNNLKEIELSPMIKIVKILFKKNGYYVLDNKNNVYSIDINNELHLIQNQYPKYNFTVSGKEIKQEKTIFYLDSKQRLWLSIKHKSGVFLKEKNTNYFIKYNSLPIDELFVWVSEDKTGKLLFGSTDDHLFTKSYYILDQKSIIHKWDYLASIFIFPKKIISDDFYKEMYVSTYRNLIILSFINNDFLISSFVNEEEINNFGSYGNLIWGICQINKDSIFSTSEKRNRLLLNTKTLKQSTAPKKDSVAIFYSKFCLKDKKIYGIARKDYFGKNKFVQIDIYTNSIKSITCPNTIMCFDINNDKDFFVFTKSDNNQYSLYLFEPIKQEFIKLTDIAFKPYFSQYDSELNYLWCVDVKHGPFYIDLNETNKKVHLLNFDKSNFGSFYCINIGVKNKIFISTSKGLLVWDKSNHKIIKHLSSKNGLSSNRLCAAQEDIMGNLWISTLYGFNYYNWKSDIVYNHYDQDGIPNNEFNTQSFFEDIDNNLYFGNSNGLLMIDINKFYKKKFQIYVDEIKNNNTILNYINSKKNKIHYDKSNNINITIGSKEWKNKESIKFYSFLSSYDENWSTATSDNHFSYKHLPKGNFNLQIKAVSGEGTISNTIEIPFEVYKNWYETDWFFNLMTTLLATSIVLGINYYFLFEKRKKERSKLIFEKRISELELGVLQAQMNPHFVFNSISAIQDKIRTGEKELVSHYLNDFASLMRLYLESSRIKELTLNDEIRLLKLYLNLEKMRFGEKMQFKIEVDPEIDAEYTKVPSMILQPFVENAINHGIFHKKTKGHILIDFSEDKNENLVVTINDDGIGRKKAMEIKQKSLHSHKSRALQIIEERISILKELHGVEINVRIEDLYDKNQKASGTKVYVTFPK